MTKKLKIAVTSAICFSALSLVVTIVLLLCGLFNSSTQGGSAMEQAVAGCTAALLFVPMIVIAGIIHALSLASSMSLIFAKKRAAVVGEFFTAMLCIFALIAYAIAYSIYFSAFTGGLAILGVVLVSLANVMLVVVTIIRSVIRRKQLKQAD